MRPMEQASLFAERDVYTPTRLNREARAHLEARFSRLWIEGEVSNLSRPASGHAYFTLKDDRAQVRCALFRSRGRELSFDLTDGQQVLARGRVSLYEPRGDYQLIVDRLEDTGEGRLRRQFEALKKRLDGEGLFDPRHKKTLPSYPTRVAIVTSPSGAAIEDVLSVLERRFPCVTVTLVPSPVQGERAPAELIRALGRAIALGPDVILLTRGGGSLEDLWAFNDEALARAIFDCPLPVVCAVGHEIDFTIAEFVADVRAPTPSAAAELLVPDGPALIRTLSRQRARIERAQQRLLLQHAQGLDRLARRLQLLHPGQRLGAARERIKELKARQRRAWRAGDSERRRRLERARDNLARHSPLAVIRQRREALRYFAGRLRAAIRSRLELSGLRLAASGKALTAVGPLAVLERGYSLTLTEDGRVLRRAADVVPGAALETRLHEGSVRSTVVSANSD